MVKDILSHGSALILLAWFSSFSIFFVILPDELRWAYILFFPFLIAREVHRRWQEQRLRLRVNLVDGLLLVYCLYVAVSLFTNAALPLPKAVYGVDFLFQFFVPISLFLYLRLVPPSSSDLRLITYGLVIIVLVQAVFGVISLRCPDCLWLPYQPRPAHVFTRATGTLVSPEAYVMTLLFSMVMILRLALETERSRERYFLWIILAIGVLAVLISGNRTGWVVLVLLLLLTAILERRLIQWMVAAAIVGGLALLLIVPNFLQRSLERLQEWRQIESRITMNVAGLRLFFEKPLFGWGYASYDLYDWQYMQPVGQIQSTIYELAVATSHNTYLTILAETGMVGFALLLLPTLYYFLRSLLAWRKFQHPREMILLWAIVFMVHLSGQTADLRFFPFILAYWFFALALIAHRLQAIPPEPA